MNIRTLALGSLVFSIACSKSSDLNSYRPSMTMLRIGEVVVDDEPVIPEDRFIPGLVTAPEQFLYEDEQENFRRPGRTAGLTDFSSMDQLDDPEQLEKHKEAYAYSMKDGSLIDENLEMGIAYDDVNQGAIGDCYMVAALAGVVYADDGGALTDGMIREITDADGSLLHYSVRFHDYRGDPQDVAVDAELVRRSDKPLYARSDDSSSSGEELWVGLVEKAYASWHGSYEKIGNGGYTGDVMQALTGANANYRRLKYLSDETVFRSVVDAVNEGRPVASGTFGKDDGVDYEGTGVYAWHAYTVLGATQTEEGTYRIQLRNPWGSSEPADNGPDDGIFWMDFADWRRLYQNVVIGGRAEADVTAPAAVTDLSVVQVLDDGAMLKFTSTGDDSTSGLAHEYDLRVSNSPIDESNFFDATRVRIAAPQAPNTDEVVQLFTNLIGQYYVAVRVVDESGNISPISNVVTIGDIRPTPPPAPGEYSFDFENQQDGWTSTGLFHRSTVDSVSGAVSFYMGVEPALDYDIGAAATGALTSPVIDLTGYSVAEILWEQTLDVEDGEYDEAWLHISTDGFATSTVVWQKGLTSPSWVVEYADISDFAGSPIQLRFEFDSRDAEANSTLGWLIDDVIIDAR